MAKPATILIMLVVVWIVVRLIYVHAITPSRDFARQPREKGQRIAELVPREQTLCLLNLKDDGLMFYYNRDVKRLASPASVRATSESYFLLTESEWALFPRRERAEVLEWSSDQQGAPIVLVRLGTRTTNDEQSVRRSPE